MNIRRTRDETLKLRNAVEHRCVETLLLTSGGTKPASAASLQCRERDVQVVSTLHILLIVFAAMLLDQQDLRQTISSIFLSHCAPTGTLRLSSRVLPNECELERGIEPCYCLHFTPFTRSPPLRMCEGVSKRLRWVLWF